MITCDFCGWHCSNGGHHHGWIHELNGRVAHHQQYAFCYSKKNNETRIVDVSYHPDEPNYLKLVIPGITSFDDCVKQLEAA